MYRLKLSTTFLNGIVTFMRPSTDTEKAVSPGRESAVLWGLGLGGELSRFSEIIGLLLPWIRPTAGAMVERCEFKPETIYGYCQLSARGLPTKNSDFFIPQGRT